MNDIKKKKFFDNFILVFILMQPFIDALTCIQIKSNLNILSISVVFRGLAFLIILMYLVFKKDKRKSIFFFLVYILSVPDSRTLISYMPFSAPKRS